MEALSDATYFNQVKIPESVVEIEELWYDIYTDTGYEKRKLRYIEPEQFLKKILANSQTENTIQVETPIFNSSLLPVKTDQDPTCYTTFDEEHLFFDAVNSSYESSIQASRITAWCTYVPDFIREDDFIPDLKIDEFPLLLSEAKSTCFINFKGVSNSKSEQTSRRQRLRQQNNRSRIKTSNKRKIGSTNKVGRRTRRG
jgi:hypothetical protein